MSKLETFIQFWTNFRSYSSITVKPNIMESIIVKHLLNNHRAEIEKQLTALVSVAKRLKLTPPTWSFGDVYEHEFSVSMGTHGYGEEREEDFEDYIEPCFDITLNVEQTLKIDGNWIFACAIDHRAKVMIQVDESVEIPMKYTPSNDCCEHCGMRTPRVKSFIIKSNDTGEFKQVGKGCLKQFLGINPASYITMFEAISKFSPIVAGYGRKNRGGRLEDLAYNVFDMFRYTAHQVAKDGKFVKALWEERGTGKYYRHGGEIMKNCRVNEGEATLDKVRQRLTAISFFRLNPNSKNDTTTIGQLEERLRIAERRLGLFEKATERSGEIKYLINNIKSHITAIRYKELLEENILSYDVEFAGIKKFAEDLHIPTEEEATSLNGFDQYKQLLKTVYLKDRTLQSNLKTIVSGYGFWQKVLEKEKENAIRKENSKHLSYIGTVGEKSELILKVLSLKTGQGAFGTWKLWHLEDEKGNKFSKFGELNRIYTIEEVSPDKNQGNANIGSTIAITAVIKSHKEFKEEKVTELGKISQIKKTQYLYKEKTKK